MLFSTFPPIVILMHVELTKVITQQNSLNLLQCLAIYTYVIALPMKKLIASVDDRHKCEITIQKRQVSYRRMKGICLWLHTALIRLINVFGFYSYSTDCKKEYELIHLTTQMSQQLHETWTTSWQSRMRYSVQSGPNFIAQCTPYILQNIRNEQSQKLKHTVKTNTLKKGSWTQLCKNKSTVLKTLNMGR